MALARLSTVLLLASPVACALRDVPGPPGEEQVVVQGVLSAQASQQVLWIERTIPAGEQVSYGVRPLSPPPTRVEVRDSTGVIFRFQPDSANPARFLAAFRPTPGWPYDLLIEAGGHTLSASTRVPSTITIVDPATDTVTVFFRPATLRLAWSGPIRPVRVAYADTAGRAAYSSPVWATTDTAIALADFPSVPTMQVWVVSVDSVTARVGDPFVFSLDPSLFDQMRGNVTGGAGFFGAATADHIVVRLQ